jgi:hypothetical protein
MTTLKTCCSLWLALIGSLLILVVAPTHAFRVVPAERPNEYLKWGDSHRAGTGGGVVTWGFVAAGTPGSSYCSNYCGGTSLGALPHFYATPDTDNTTKPITLVGLQPVFQAAFDAWSGVANVQFRYVGVDDSLKAINDPTVTSPMIRIGVWRFKGLIAYLGAGAAFPPGLNGGSGVGHIFINYNVGYQLSIRPENSRLQDFPAGNGLYMTDVYLLALHEIGHVIGLAGSSDPDSVMFHRDSSATLTRTYMWRRPRADDIAGARFLYGPHRLRLGDHALEASSLLGTDQHRYQGSSS